MFLCAPVSCPLTSLPVTAPIFALGVRKRETKRAACHRAIVEATMIFKPCSMRSVLMKILRADVMMLPVNHAPQPGEEAFDLIGRNAVQAVGEAVIDPLRFVV